MRFRLKMTVCMVWLLTLAYGLGGTLLITRAFDYALRREQTAALESYRTTVRTVRLVRTLGMRRDRTAVSATLERLRGTAAWCALYLTQDGEQLYGSGARFARRTPPFRRTERRAACSFCTRSRDIICSLAGGWAS